MKPKGEGVKTHKLKTSVRLNGVSHGSRRGLSPTRLNPDGWKLECKQLLETIVQCEDSGPFRHPVDINTYIDYYNVIEFPMDLSIVRENMDKSLYKTPLQFARDMKLIFTNSKTYNTNKRAKIYSMTLRLSAMFESRMKEILKTYQKALKLQGRNVTNHNRPRYGEAANAVTAVSSRRSPQPGTSALTNGRHHSSEDDDTEEESYSRDSFTRTRPLRERRTVQRNTGYNDSDPDNHDFPEPKPDYSDDDYEIQPRKSPRKKGARSRSARKVAANDCSANESLASSSTRYSTRARTGTLKMRKYTNEGFLTDDDEADSVIHKNNRTKANGSHSRGDRVRSRGSTSHDDGAGDGADDSGSDTEVESPRSHARQPARGLGRRKVESLDEDEEESETDSETELSDVPKRSRKQGRGRYSKRKTQAQRRGRPPTKRLRTRGISDSEREEETGEETGSSSSSSEAWMILKQLEEEDHSPVTRLRASQGSKRTHDSESDSSPPGRLTKYENSRSRQGRQTRNQGKSTVKYVEDSGNTDSDEGSSVTVSMRGRVRRPTARARAMWD